METGMTTIAADLGSMEKKTPIPRDRRFFNFITADPEAFREWLAENNAKAENNRFWKSIRV